VSATTPVTDVVAPREESKTGERQKKEKKEEKVDQKAAHKDKSAAKQASTPKGKAKTEAKQSQSKHESKTSPERKIEKTVAPKQEPPSVKPQTSSSKSNNGGGNHNGHTNGSKNGKKHSRKKSGGKQTPVRSESPANVSAATPKGNAKNHSKQNGTSVANSQPKVETPPVKSDSGAQSSSGLLILLGLVAAVVLVTFLVVQATNSLGTVAAAQELSNSNLPPGNFLPDSDSEPTIVEQGEASEARPDANEAPVASPFVQPQGSVSVFVGLATANAQVHELVLFSTLFVSCLAGSAWSGLMAV
jgi:hypothetical protein